MSKNSAEDQLAEKRASRDKLNEEIVALEQQLGEQPARRGGGTPAGEEPSRTRPHPE